MDHFKECLKRSYVDGPGASVLPATEKAREQNLARQALGQHRAAALYLIHRARAAFEQNVFAPEYEVDDAMAMAIDHEAVIDEYKKTFLQTNQRQFSPKLYSELPETPQRELEIEGEMVGPRHPAFKLALLTRMCDHHLLRQFGGVWRLAYDGSTHPSPRNPYSSS